MDLDAYVAVHRPGWARLEELVRRARRPRRMTGAEVDELVALYQQTATALSQVRSASPDAALVAELSSLVARARGAVTGTRTPAWRDAATFLAVTFPTVVYRARWWWVGAAAGFLAVAFGLGGWIAVSPDVQAALLPPEDVRRLVEDDFAGYYSENAAQTFAARVWLNNALAAATALVLGVFLGIPSVLALVVNAVNVGVVGGFMTANGAAPLFFGLILPHGLLELTAVFVAAGVGLRLGWTVVDPGPRTRADALAQEGRAAVSVALGLVLVLAVSGAIEGFVTPSPLPTGARLAIGVVAEVAFLAWVLVLGRRGARAGVTGDLAGDLRPDAVPVA